MCDNYYMDHLDAQEPTPKHNNSTLARKFVLPAIIFLTILGMAIPIFSFYLGYSISFINILYLPLVITCITYPKQGILYTTCISICYFLLLILLPGEPSLFLVALIRVTGLELIALLIIKLSNKKNQTARELQRQQENLETVIRERTEVLTRELEQSRRIETVYRTTMDLYDVCIKQLRMYYVQWNAELYITRTNEPFEELIGRVKSDLVGRRISTIPWLEEASRKHEERSFIVPITGPDRKTRSVLWIFTEMFTEDSDSPFMIVGAGIAIPED